MCGWTKWAVEALFHGLKELDVFIIWSIKEKYQEFIPNKNDPKFWISSWLPQVELLSHSGVKAGLTHCGFGGIQEYLNAGIPLVCVAHFGDQYDNARLIEEQGIGLNLIAPKHAMRPF